jgi:hypothetical protein
MRTEDKARSSNHSTLCSQTCKLSRAGRTLTVSVALLCGLAVSVLSMDAIAQAQTNPKQTTTDQSGWVQVPGELIRPDCVHEIPNGAAVEVRDDQTTVDVTLDGVLMAHYDACPQEAMVTRPRTRTEVLAHAPGMGNGRIEADLWNVPLEANDDIDYLAGAWTVPSYPLESGALIYLFNGIESSSGGWMLQPVLQYGTSPAGGGDFWAVASWLVSSNQAFHTPLKTVFPGNSIKGYIEMPDISGSAKHWEVEARDTTTGANSYVSAYVSEQHWTWAYAGVLEAYNVTSCGQFPSNGREVFKGSVVNHGFPAYVPPSRQGWNGAVYSYGGRSCNFAVVAASGTPHF